jgi:uncharacterized membrane protein (DUF106 family)
MAFLDAFLTLPPVISIMIVSLVISVFMVFVYKWMTDQRLMKELKTKMKGLQDKMKASRDNPKKLMEYQKDAMESNMQYMMQSFKPTLVTFIPIILVFGWLNTHMGYDPLIQDTQFTITAAFDPGATGMIDMVNLPKDITLLTAERQNIVNSSAKWALQGKAGRYTLSYKYGDVTVQHPIVITDGEHTYAKPILREQDLGVKNTILSTITISNKRVEPLRNIPIIGMIPWINGFGWLGTYILFSIGFSMLIRRMLKVY